MFRTRNAKLVVFIPPLPEIEYPQSKTLLTQKAYLVLIDYENKLFHYRANK